MTTAVEALVLERGESVNFSLAGDFNATSREEVGESPAAAQRKIQP
jgi:hypothetical protein